MESGDSFSAASKREGTSNAEVPKKDRRSIADIENSSKQNEGGIVHNVTTHDISAFYSNIGLSSTGRKE